MIFDTNAPLFLYRASTNNNTCYQDTGEVESSLQWYHVGIASMFILINGVISIWLGLHLEASLFVSSVRCVVQLTLMGLVLEDVFKAENPFIVLAMIFILVFLGANEIVLNKSKRRHSGMFISVLLSLGLSTMVVGIIGSRYALNQEEFWDPQIFIPTMGMLLGNGMSAIAVGTSYALNQFSEQKEKLEMYLSFGASRWEAGRPVAVEAIRLAMLPTINSMSIIGLISIPGMMTGQIIGGAPIMVAVKYQQIIMFMISASTALGVLSSIVVCVFSCIDSSHRLRTERISSSKPWIFAKKDELLNIIRRGICFLWKRPKKVNVEEESLGLLSNRVES
ncbi:14789_t:CDS:10 [Funneliformis geosporum]|nr:14789_t:CDS:10 [Funneliformis geosporum]